jgi:DNA-binding IclR family transcriptional regulator
VSQSVRAVERALDILLCFTREEQICSLSQIARSVHMSKTTVHRLLTTLEKKQFVTRDRIPGRYCLDFRFMEMASLTRNPKRSNSLEFAVPEQPAKAGLNSIPNAR